MNRRLCAIAALVKNGKGLVDVGTDHGYLPVSLARHGYPGNLIASDIREGPLSVARRSAEAAGFEKRIRFQLCDGLDGSDPAAIDTIVIAGMGFHTIKHVLESCDVSRYQYFLVQSNTDVDELRRYISEKGYTIEDERVVYDGFYYQVIRFSADLHEPYSEMEIKYGPILLKRRDEVFIAYLKDLLERYKKINESANKKEFEEKISEIEKILYNSSM